MVLVVLLFLFFFKQKTAYEMRISDWSSDVCSSDLGEPICAANWGDRRSLKAGAHPCQNATTHREKRLRGAGFDATPRALHGTEIIGFAQRAKGGGVSPPLRRQPDWPRRSEERRVGKECVRTCRSRGAANH